MRRHPNVGSLRLLPCPHLQGLPRDMLTEPLCRTDPGLPVSHLRTPRCLPRMWIWRMVAGVRKSLRETMSCFWGVRNLPWTRALGYPRGMSLGRPEDAPFNGRREKLKRIGGPQGAPWDVFSKSQQFRQLFQKRFAGGICDLGGTHHVLCDTQPPSI